MFLIDMFLIKSSVYPYYSKIPQKRKGGRTPPLEVEGGLNPQVPYSTTLHLSQLLHMLSCMLFIKFNTRKIHLFTSLHFVIPEKKYSNVISFIWITFDTSDSRMQTFSSLAYVELRYQI